MIQGDLLGHLSIGIFESARISAPMSVWVFMTSILLGRQLSRFLEDGVGKADLADVVQRGRQADRSSSSPNQPAAAARISLSIPFAACASPSCRRTTATRTLHGK